MSYSANDNQNYFVAEGRTTSRVMAQPGGQCSISIGGWTAEELEEQRKRREQREVGVPKVEKTEEQKLVDKSPETVIVVPPGKENNDAEEQPKESEQAMVKVVSQPPPTQPSSISSNAFASSSNTNSFNVITDRPTSRVSMPPGGHSSIRLW